MISINEFEKKCSQFLEELRIADSAHDLVHTVRVVASAKQIIETERADAEIVISAAWLHDCVVLPKNHPERDKASVLAADKAVEFLHSVNFSADKLNAIHHAVAAHSFSAGIKPETLEAKIVQDADRLDALGAIGIARCLLTGGDLQRPLYDAIDPFCENREPDDSVWTIDHFYSKLFKLPELMNTETAKEEAYKRVRYMEGFLRKLKEEISMQIGDKY